MTGALAGDLISCTLPGGVKVGIYERVVERQFRYHTNFVWCRYDKSAKTSCDSRLLLPAPTPDRPVPVTRYPETFGGILYRERLAEKAFGRVYYDVFRPATDPPLNGPNRRAALVTKWNDSCPFLKATAHTPG